MRILAIETSCDETSVSIVENGTTVLCSVIASSMEIFKSSGGVVPEDAARRQVECILPVLHKALEDAGISVDHIDAIAVTRGPGLLGSLLVGTTCARVIASLWRKPLMGVHHTLGHLSSTWLIDKTSDIGLRTTDCPQFPIITLSVSGGHSDIWYRTSHLKGVILGHTRDDAAGEAFDKGATMLGLPYPGGPSISKAAEDGNEKAYEFPVPLRNDATLDFSFSGLKTALKYTIRDLDGTPNINDLAASYQYAINYHLVHNLKKALEQYSDCKEVHLVGGVSANTRLREMTREVCGSLPVRNPHKIQFCTDNAAMIASAAYFLHQEIGEKAYEQFETRAELPLSDVIST